LASRYAPAMIAEALTIGALGAYAIGFPGLAKLAPRTLVARSPSLVMHCRSPHARVRNLSEPRPLSGN
jgi:hypothetical protein